MATPLSFLPAGVGGGVSKGKDSRRLFLSRV